jgi:hypothetical protein
MSAGNLSVGLFGENFRQNQTPRIFEEGIFFHKCPFPIITNYVLEKEAFQGKKIHHTPFRLGAVILPVLSTVSTTSFINQQLQMKYWMIVINAISEN